MNAAVNVPARVYGAILFGQWSRANEKKNLWQVQ
jgi:hypothetical protein